VTASQEVYNEVSGFAEKSANHCGFDRSVGARAITLLGTDKIVANGSITGSIGVIAEWVNYGELLK
jgi:protease-4